VTLLVWALNLSERAFHKKGSPVAFRPRASVFIVFVLVCRITKKGIAEFYPGEIVAGALKPLAGIF
jgi:hypothetical protein